MLKTTVYLDGDLALALRQLAEVRGASQAGLIREALRIFTQDADDKNHRRVRRVVEQDPGPIIIPAPMGSSSSRRRIWQGAAN